MERLSSRDLAALLEFLQANYALRDLPDFHTHVVAAFAKLVPSEVTTYSLSDMSGNRLVEQTTTPTDAHDAIASPQLTEAYGRFVNQHPILPVVQAGDQGVHKMSDFLSSIRFHDLALYQEFFGRISVEYQMGFALAVDRFLVASLSVNRGCRDFTERERLLMTLARPHIVQAYQNAVAFTSLKQELASVPAHFAQESQTKIVLTRDARVLSMSPGAEAVLERYFGNRADTDPVPDMLERWIKEQQGRTMNLEVPEPLIVERQDRRLLVRIVSDDDRLVLLLSERVKEPDLDGVQALGLTRREAQVLVWVAQGKTNPEIALVLDCRVRTVKKHLERIFGKLGVETRTAAALRFWQVTGSK